MNLGHKQFCRLLAILLTLPVQAATVYIDEDFRGTSADDWVFEAAQAVTPSLTAGVDDPVNDGWLRLTRADYNQSAFAYCQTAFPSHKGVQITFDYCMWGGSGADGLTVALFDASTENPSPGGYGGSLGYAQRSGIEGMAGAAVGFGFDEFGNFSNPSEGRIGGPGRVPDSIVIRGSESLNYAYMAGTNLSHLGDFDFAGATERPDQTGEDRRTARITILPNHHVTVEVRYGNDADFVTVIDQWDCPLTCPESVQIAFTAGTGAAYSNHEIRNLKVQDGGPIAAIPEANSLSLLLFSSGLLWVRRRNFAVSEG
jgi:hypothetical protein